MLHQNSLVQHHQLVASSTNAAVACALLLCTCLCRLQVFDVRAQRLAGTGAAPAAAAGKQRGGSATGRSCRGGQQAAADKRPAVSAAQAKKAKWLMQSEQLRAAMRSTRPQAAGGAEGWGGAAAQVEEVADTR